MNRRSFLKATAGVVALALSPFTLSSEPEIIPEMYYTVQYRPAFLAHLHTWTYRYQGERWEYSALVMDEVSEQQREIIVEYHRQMAYEQFKKEVKKLHEGR